MHAYKRNTGFVVSSSPCPRLETRVLSGNMHGVKKIYAYKRNMVSWPALEYTYVAGGNTTKLRELWDMIAFVLRLVV